MDQSLEPRARPTNQAPRYLPLETTAVRLEGTAFRGSRSVFGILANISDTGACIIANSNVPEEASVLISLVIEPRDIQLDMRARVVWCQERVEPIKEIAGYLTGVRFDEAADDAILDLIESGVFRPNP